LKLIYINQKYLADILFA